MLPFALTSHARKWVFSAEQLREQRAAANERAARLVSKAHEVGGEAVEALSCEEERLLVCKFLTIEPPQLCAHERVNADERMQMIRPHVRPLTTARISGSNAGDEHFLELDCDGLTTAGPIAVADTRYSVAIYDRATLRLTAQTAGAHGGRINCVRFARLAPSSSPAFFSASEDGHIRAWDPAQGLARPCLDFSDPAAPPVLPDDEAGSGFCSVDVDATGALVAAGAEARVLLWDVRVPSRVLRSFTEVHTEACTSVTFCAGDRERLLTGSVDGLLCVLDATRAPEDEELVRTVCSVGDAVVRAGAFTNWDAAEPHRAHAFCVSGSEAVSVWDLDDGVGRGGWRDICQGRLDEIEAAPVGEDPLANGSAGVEYLLDCFASGPSRPALSIVAGTHCGSIHVLELAPEGARPTLRAVLAAGGQSSGEGGHCATVRACKWAEASQRLYTIGEDGLLCCWDGDAMFLEPAPDASDDRLVQSETITGPERERSAPSAVRDDGDGVVCTSAQRAQSRRPCVARARRDRRQFTLLLASSSRAYAHWLSTVRYYGSARHAPGGVGQNTYRL
jgi:WD40 repeat protein